MALREVFGLVGVDAGGGEDRGESLLEPEDRRQAGGLGEVRRAEDDDDARGERTADGFLSVRIEIGHTQVGVRIDQTGKRQGRRHPVLLVLRVYALDGPRAAGTVRSGFGLTGPPGHWDNFGFSNRRGMAP
jgi:hypothetical protein